MDHVCHSSRPIGESTHTTADCMGITVGPRAGKIDVINRVMMLTIQLLASYGRDERASGKRTAGLNFHLQWRVYVVVLVFYQLVGRGS